MRTIPKTSFSVLTLFVIAGIAIVGGIALGQDPPVPPPGIVFQAAPTPKVIPPGSRHVSDVPPKLGGPVLVEVPSSQASVQEKLTTARSTPFRSPSEADLRDVLRAVPEIGLTRDNLRWLAHARPADEKGKHALETLLGVEPGRIQALPFDFGPSCLSEAEHARNLDTHSRNLRPALRNGGIARSVFLLDFGWLRPESVGARLQMISGSDTDWRLALVQQLSFTPGSEASRALANRAVFDLSSEVRSAAIAALRDRPQQDYADVLARAFRYPWAPVADHAAQAVVDLKAHELKTPLTRMLELPDPAAPTKRVVHGAETLVVPQMVRVNHLKNCLLCHQRSAQNEGTVLGGVPDWDQPLPSYDDFGGPARVRADVVYLRQDFSVIQPVEQPRLWPVEQRFDYFIRTRSLSPTEASAWNRALAGRDYPQLEAVRFALRALDPK